MTYRAAVQIVNPQYGPETVLLFSRAGHTYHASRSAAQRAVTRPCQSGCAIRGFIWPISAGPHLTTADLTAGHIPAYVETIAL